MCRHCKSILLYSILLFAALMPARLSAQGDEKKLPVAKTDPADELKTTLAELKTGIEKLTTAVAALQAEQQRQKLALDDLHKKLQANGSAVPTFDKALLEELRGTLSALNSTLAKLAPAEKRISLSPPITNPVSAGRVKLDNFYALDLLFVINGTPHRVAPNTSRIIDNVPAGAMRYEVFSEYFGIIERQTYNLTSGETYTLTAANRR